jgi:hypothetical protein
MESKQPGLMNINPMPNAASFVENCDTWKEMKRIEFTITDEGGQSLREPSFVENCSELPLAVMRAVEDFVEAHEGEVELPITIHVQSAMSSATC